MNELPPIRRELLVELNTEDAFELFTAGIGDWWPLARLSVFGEGASVGFEGDELVERLGDQRASWGHVIDWIPGQRVSFSWHPGAPEAQQASWVSVFFEADGEQTRVVLEHSGWEAYDDPAGTRSEYDQGWPTVLGLFQAAAAQSAQSADTGGPGATWVALLHRPGPEASAEAPIFEQAGFAQHVEFLGRMREAGYLVAAGPMLDAPGEGMTILRLPGEDRLGEAQRLATTEDLSVSSGFFEVTVRPWHVVMAR